MTRQKLEDFISEHPRCCFCAGERPTKSRDHQPPRSWFRGKRMPDGIVVPACTQCQECSRAGENLISLTFLPERYTDEDRNAWEKRLAFASRNAPEMVPRIAGSAREARTIARERGLKLPAGMTFSRAPFVTLDGNVANPLFATVAKKMTLAHHYRSFGQPLSRDGRVYAEVIPIAETTAEFEQEMIADLPNLEVPRHGREDLGDQLLTRWRTFKTERAGFFLTRVHNAFIIYGNTADSPSSAAELSMYGADEPFKWA